MAIFFVGLLLRFYNIPFVLNCNSLLSIWITLFVIVFMYLVLARLVKSRLDVFTFGMLTGGAVSNLVERAVFTCVRDYFNFFNLFSFNLADIAITVGVLVLLERGFIRFFISRKIE